MYKQKQTETNMLDATVKFEDVAADIIALEDVRFEDIDSDTMCIEHFDDMQQELGMTTVWSIWDGGAVSNRHAIFSDKIHRVVYEYVRNDATREELTADFEDGGKRSMAEVSCLAVDGTVQSLWVAAESCVMQSGTHHRFIEGFDVNKNGTLSLITGS